MCSLLPYHTGICHYASLWCFFYFGIVSVRAFFRLLFNVALINQMEPSMVPVRPSLICFFNKAVLKGLTLWKFAFDIFVRMLCFMFVYDWVCNILLQKGFPYNYEKRSEMYICLWQGLIVLTWPCAADRMLKSNYFMNSYFPFEPTLTKGHLSFMTTFVWFLPWSEQRGSSV